MRTFFALNKLLSITDTVPIKYVIVNQPQVRLILKITIAVWSVNCVLLKLQGQVKKIILSQAGQNKMLEMKSKKKRNRRRKRVIFVGVLLFLPLYYT